MTRINVVPVQELHHKHLVAEYKEIVRVFGLARKSQFDVIKGKRKLPVQYTLGTGHVLFFYDKLQYALDRYQQLAQEMQSRNYKPNPVALSELQQGINPLLFKQYIPTAEAITINKARLEERLIAMQDKQNKSKHS